MSVLFDEAVPHPDGYREVAPSRVAATRGRVRIVDVREPQELAEELGRIPGMENVPLATLEHAAARWGRDQEIVLVCRSGGRSTRATRALVALGFRRVMNMSGGMIAWNEARLPTARTATTES